MKYVTTIELNIVGKTFQEKKTNELGASLRNRGIVDGT